MGSEYAEQGLRYLVEGQVATITLCRPETRNAQTPALWAAMVEIEQMLPSTVRVVVVAGDGPSFSSGLDRRMFTAAGTPAAMSLLRLQALDDNEIEAALEGFQSAFGWLRRPDLITIAAVQGHAVGAGFQLALACDLRVVADSAQFAMRETSLGLVPDLGGTQPLVEAVGYSRALELCVTGRWVGAHEALQLGLATIVVPPGDLGPAVHDLVAAVTGPDQAAVSATKAVLRNASSNGYREQLRVERKAQVARIRALSPKRTGAGTGGGPEGTSGVEPALPPPR